jgi:RNA polymerase sigma-70 factor (ECF subfamily)
MNKVMARQRRAADAEAEAEQFSALFRENYPQIVAFARRRVGPDACQEIAAETFLVAWRRFDSVPDSALPWLYQVATFTIANHRRREAKTVPYGASSSLDLLVSATTTEDESDARDLIKVAFTSLGLKDQEVLRLAAWDGLSSAEGAAVLGCSVTAYKVRLHRARTRLAKKFTSPQVCTQATEQPRGVAIPPSEQARPFRAAEESA